MDPVRPYVNANGEVVSYAQSGAQPPTGSIAASPPGAPQPAAPVAAAPTAPAPAVAPVAPVAPPRPTIDPITGQPVALADPLAPPPAAAGPVPAYVTPDQLTSVQETITQQNQLIQQQAGQIDALTRVAAARPEPVAPLRPPVPEVTDEQIQQAIDEGRGATVVRRLVDTKIAGAREQFEAQLNATQQQNVAVASSIAKSVAMGQVDSILYKRFEREIQGHVDSIPVGTMLTPEHYVTVYNAVVGAHQPALQAEAVEAALRQARENPGALVPGSAAGIQAAGQPVAPPSVAEIFGDSAAAALAAVGQTPDDFARKMGYPTYQAYVDERSAVYEDERKMRGVQ